VGALINILGYDCLTTTILGATAIVFCIAGRHARLTGAAPLRSSPQARHWNSTASSGREWNAP